MLFFYINKVIYKITFILFFKKVIKLKSILFNFIKKLFNYAVFLAVLFNVIYLNFIKYFIIINYSLKCYNIKAFIKKNI